MNHRKTVTAVLSSCGMLVLILDSKTALEGALAGVALCLKTVIPSLFPFLFLCSMLTTALWGGHAAWLRPLGAFLGIPVGAESLLVAGFLGGYPAGAQAVGEGYRAGRLTKQDAEHLLTFCSNAGPAFLFGMTAMQFPNLWMTWALWVIQIFAAIIVAALDANNIPGESTLPPKNIAVSQTLATSVKTMGIICGWIVLFRILLIFLDRWILWSLPSPFRVALAGVLELSNGCCSLSSIESIPMRFVVCSGILSFGGLCVAMQTASVIPGLSPMPYLRGKLEQTLLSVILSTVVMTWGFAAAGILAGCLLVFPRIRKKRSRFPKAYGV